MLFKALFLSYLIEVVAVSVADVAHFDLGRPQAIRVAGGVVVLGHAPTADLAVVLI